MKDLTNRYAAADAVTHAKLHQTVKQIILQDSSENILKMIQKGLGAILEGVLRGSEQHPKDRTQAGSFFYIFLIHFSSMLVPGWLHVRSRTEQNYHQEIIKERCRKKAQKCKGKTTKDIQKGNSKLL